MGKILVFLCLVEKILINNTISTAFKASFFGNKINIQNQLEDVL